jgi:hypothetical protein
LNRRKLEQILAHGQEALERQEREAAREAKRKARQDWLNEPVKCALCLKDVPRKTTAKVPGLGQACKSHPGITPEE